MNNQASSCKTIPVFSGGLYVSSNPNEMLVTVLGSCVAACIHDPLLKIGGMNHFLLPVVETQNSNIPMNEESRYGAYAMEKLINELLKMGAVKERLEIKIFGGASLSRYSTAMIGQKNICFIENFLKKDGYNVKSKDVGGNNPRKIRYFPTTGKVMVKLVSSIMQQEKIITKESVYRDSLHRPKDDDIELF